MLHHNEHFSNLFFVHFTSILHLKYNKSKQALTLKVYSQLQCGISKRNQNVTLLRQTAALQSTCVHRSAKLYCDFLALILFENFCGIPCRLIFFLVLFPLLLCRKFLVKQKYGLHNQIFLTKI